MRRRRAKCFIAAMRQAVIDRPLVEAEWDMVRSFVARTAREDLRLRFGCPLDLDDAFTLRRAFDVKPGIGSMTWLLDETAAIAAIAHRVRVSPSEAEIALIVRSDLQRIGLGEFLLRDALARSARQGLAALTAMIYRENRAAMRLAVKVGYVPLAVCGFAVELMFPTGGATAA